jgi:CDP-diglyceride synthetase
MRPVSIEYFERLSFLAILVGIVFTALSWDPGQAARLHVGPMFLPIALVMCFALLALLILLISRRASVIAQTLFLLLVAAGAVLAAPAVPAILSGGQIGLLQLAQIAMQAIAIYFLLTPEARAWMRAKRAGRSMEAVGTPS